jgi:peroxiredoxin
VPSITLAATDGSLVDLAALTGRTLLTVYPYTGQPSVPDPSGWDDIPGAHGSTPQLKALAAVYDRLTAAGLRVLAVSPQDMGWQQEAVARLGLPFPLLSDADYALQRALKLPVFQAGGVAYPVRLSLLLRDGALERVFHPIADPVTDAAAHPEEILAHCATA